MILPPLLVLTDRHQASLPLIEVVAAVIEAGARAVVLRETDLLRAERTELAATVAPLIHDVGGLLLSAAEALPLCDGIHLRAPSRTSTAGSAAQPNNAVVGQSCHDADEVHAAQTGGVDYVTLSPVFLTHSKPGYGPALGVARLADLIAQTAVAVYALGGIETPDQVRACRQAGAAGVAVMGTVMRSEDPGRVVGDLLGATPEVGPR